MEGAHPLEVAVAPSRLPHRGGVSDQVQQVSFDYRLPNPAGLVEAGVTEVFKGEVSDSEEGLGPASPAQSDGVLHVFIDELVPLTEHVNYVENLAVGSRPREEGEIVATGV